MIAGLGIGSDARRYFHFSLPRIAIVTVVLMPLLYGALYLWTFWDPFGEVNKIPVAIVNVDTGTTLAGESLDAGEQVTTQLIESGQLDLTKVSDEATAMADLERGKFYFVIVIPEDFSEAVASPVGDNPRQAELKFYFNDANSYLSTVIGQDAASEVINQVNSAISQQSLGQVLLAVAAGDPAAELVDSGAQELAKGLEEATNAAGQLQAGSQQLGAPLTTAASDTARLATAANDLLVRIDQVTAQLQASVGANPIPQQVAAINSEVSQTLSASIARLRVLDDPITQDVANQLEAANASLNRASTLLAGTVNQTDTDIIVAIGQLSAAAATLNNGVNVLNQDMAQLAAGGQEVAAGTAEFASLLQELAGGADKLANGFTSVLSQVPHWSQDQREAVATALATPVLLQEQTLNEAPNFGTGFAPFFMSLALFVGGIIIWMILTPLRSRPVQGGVPLLRAVFISYWPALLIGVLQAVVLFGAVLVIGLRPTHLVGMGLFAMLVSATFLALIQAFNAVFGEAVGRVVTLAFLMLQLVSSGGIYPVQTTAGPIQALHVFDPMTYTVNGYRQLSVAGSVDSRLWVAIGVLLAILCVSFAASVLAARRNQVYTMTRLYPMVVV